MLLLKSSLWEPSNTVTHVLPRSIVDAYSSLLTFLSLSRRLVLSFFGVHARNFFFFFQFDGPPGEEKNGILDNRASYISLNMIYREMLQ